MQASTSANGSTVPLTPVHIEVRLRPSSTATNEAVRAETIAFLTSRNTNLQGVRDITEFPTSPFLTANIDRIRIAEIAPSPLVCLVLPVSHAKLEVHVYQPSSTDIIDEFSAADPSADEGEETTAASVAECPTAVWTVCGTASCTKTISSRSCSTTSTRRCSFPMPTSTSTSSRGTALCFSTAHQAQARRASARRLPKASHPTLTPLLARQARRDQQHSLFSKWFSESGKLVQRLFSMITRGRGRRCLCRRTHRRSRVAYRSSKCRLVRNRTHRLDSCGQRAPDTAGQAQASQNVLIMTTSNITESIDDAFIDRADIKQYIGLPPPKRSTGSWRAASASSCVWDS